MKRTINYYITNDNASLKISEYLHKRGYSEKSLTRLRHSPGAICLDGKECHMNARLEDAKMLSVLIEETSSSINIPPVEIPLDIVYEDEDLLVINKPAFLPIHPSKKHFEDSLANGLAYYFAQKGIPFTFRCVNRLDRDTSGLTIIAKHYVSAGILFDAVKNRQVKRIYYAIVEDVNGDLPAKGDIELPLGPLPDSGVMRCVDFLNGDYALTHYEVLKRQNGTAFVSCQLATGRTHQIRLHMKAIGHPLIGDFLYNPSNKQMSRQALHAGELSFIHPITGKEMHFTVPLPEDMKCIICE